MNANKRHAMVAEYATKLVSLAISVTEMCSEFDKANDEELEYVSPETRERYRMLAANEADVRSVCNELWCASFDAKCVRDIEESVRIALDKANEFTADFMWTALKPILYNLRNKENEG